MRYVPASFDPVVVDEIDHRLHQVTLDHGVTVPWAIESGSRAWGFPSPDSDYDCRFIFVRSFDDYVSLWPKRDVIETPLDKVFDVNGWDLSKALRLMLKGNAVLVEWLSSPIVYSGDARFRTELLALATEVSDPLRIGRHYLHVGRQQWPAQSDDVLLKKVFYALRPAAALRWLRTHPSQSTPPMDVSTLLEQGDVRPEVIDEATDLIRLKAITREIGRGDFPPSLARFVADEFELATEAYEGVDLSVESAHRTLVDEFFRTNIKAGRSN
jgi:predicted nucleotidyltransferase